MSADEDIANELGKALLVVLYIIVAVVALDFSFWRHDMTYILAVIVIGILGFIGFAAYKRFHKKGP